MRVLVLERHYTAGGFTHTFRRRGFEWDVGVHYIGQMGNANTLIRRIFDDITEARLEWADMGDVYDRVIIGDDTYDFVKGPTQFRDRICSYFPEETEAIDRYLEAVKLCIDRWSQELDQEVPWSKELEVAAIKWTHEKSKRCGRTAYQFSKNWVGKYLLK